ncbi:MAG: NAD-dependent epimerase/dehydratase family protein [Nitrosopumilus sp.]|nr:MAG: NAD-dependent epimerase/dehydratase family protein [Nitrosopumilus sp.]
MKLDKDSKILITGASGFIGSKLTQKISSCNATVFYLVRNRDKASNQSNAIIVDITSPNIELPDEYFDVVYHLASATPHEKNKKILEQVNLQGTKNLFNAVKDKTKSIVYVSGLTVFDSQYENIDENTLINPDTYYTKLRVMAQRYLEEHCLQNTIEYTTAHVGDIVYGNGGFFMSDMVSRLKRNRFRIPGDGMYVKNYVHVDDVVGALLAIIEHDKTNQSFIITGSNPAPFKDFVNCISSELGMKNQRHVPEFLAKLAIGKDIVNLLTKSTSASNAKIMSIYNFQHPKYQDGIKDVFNRLNHQKT